MFEGKEYIYEVYKTRSFSKAAANLYISQPALSATVRKIEQRLQTPIFDRSTSPIQLTECGQRYIREIEKLMDMENDFENYLNDMEHLRVGHLSVGGSNLFASYILPPMLAEYMKKYPSIDVSLSEASTKDLEKKMFDGNLDFVMDNYAFSNSLYERHFFREEHLLLAVPAAFSSNEGLEGYRLSASDIRNGRHLLEQTECPPLSAFAEEPFLLLRSGNDTRERSERLFERAKISPRVLLKLDQQVTAYRIACYGMGISFVTDTLIRQAHDDGELWFYRLDEDLSRREIYFYRKQHRYLTRAMEEFIRMFEKPQGA